MGWNQKIILLTGGTGSFGQKFVEIMLKKYNPKIIRIFSRDEFKQWEMAKKFNNDERLRFFIGDIRDRKRLDRAMNGVNIVVHAAAMKQVPSCEYNPFEAVQTNILGAQNLIDTAIDHNVEKLLALSTDKAVNPANLYGATKMCMEKLFIAANAYIGPKRRTRMSCVRYGNVLGSRGSVIPLFKNQLKSGFITITDKRMTRFWLSLEEGVEFVIKSTEIMKGSEIFIPKIPSMKILDLAKAIAPQSKIKFIGIRPGEKIHEVLIAAAEARNVLEFNKFFIIHPQEPIMELDSFIRGGKKVAEGFEYSSDNNKQWFTIKELQKMIGN